MITKMKYISLSGHIAGLNHAVNRYLSRYDIQLEPARHSLLEPFTTLNPYAATLRKAERFAALTGPPPAIYLPIAPAAAVNLVEAAAAAYERRDTRLRELEDRLTETRRQIEILENFAPLDIDLHALATFEFVHFRFGKFSVENYRKFEKFLHDDARIIFLTAKRDKDFVFGVFFTPVCNKEEIDTVFASLEFEIIPMLKFFEGGGASALFASRKAAPAARPRFFAVHWEEPFFQKSFSPRDLIHSLKKNIYKMSHETELLTKHTLSSVCTPEKLAIASAKVKNLYASFDVKKYASLSRGRRVFTFFGWISAEDADKLEAEVESDDLVLFTRHATGGAEGPKPPTLLKNLPVIRQFEFFTRLYGLPEYGEIDPTPVLAVTYTLLFGLMFGDIGHGAVLALFGVFVQRRWHTNLGGIMTVVGVSAALFGILYGSIFGIEFAPVWRRPTTNITETLIFAAALGAGLIAFSMLLNMYNCFRRGKIADLLFSANGIAGLLFYSALIFLVVRVVQGRPLTPVVIIVAVLPLVLVCAKHPLENFLRGRGLMPKKSIAAFIGKTAIELFETLLTYVTNTISFVRVGAFAVSHVGMMHVVLQLSRGAAGGGIVILILGNALVLIIEGLLVGIQVLRLDFYEIFSRFYKGTGREFKSSKGNLY